MRSILNEGYRSSRFQIEVVIAYPVNRNYSACYFPFLI